MRLRFPHPLTLLVGCVLLAAVLSHILPAGQYQRQQDPAAGREVVVPGTYHQVPPRPLSAFETVVAIPKGMADAASVIFYVFLVGGAFAVVDQTGALRRVVDWVAGAGDLVVPAACIAFGIGGVLIQMQEELIAFVPVLLVLTRRMGYDRLTAVAMSIGASSVGAAFSPVDPFEVGIAQKVAQLPLGSGLWFRLIFLLPALALWTWATWRHAERTRIEPAEEPAGEPAGTAGGTRRHGLIVLLVLVTFAVFVYGELRLGWDFDQLAALFFVMGVAAGLIGGLGLGGTADGFVEGFRAMAFAGLLIGFARAIYVALQQGLVIDTLVHGLFAPISHLPTTLAALGMMLLQAGIHFPVPSTSGQAVLTMPVLVPLSDLLGLSRQVTVLAYQYGAGLCELLTPTNGALMAMLAAAGVRFEGWLRFVLPVLGLLAALGATGIVVAVLRGLA